VAKAPSTDTANLWYAGGLSFACTGCGECCTGKPGYVWVNDAEITRIAEYVGMSRSDFRKRYLKLTFGGYSIVEKSNYDCAFLDKPRCLIYEVRPRQCRTWPFWTENVRSREDWEEEAVNCPGMNRGKKYSVEEINRILNGSSET